MRAQGTFVLVWLLTGLGAALGFCVAVPIAVLNLHTPVTPVLACALAGVGSLFGAGWSRRR